MRLPALLFALVALTAALSLPIAHAQLPTASTQDKPPVAVTLDPTAATEAYMNRLTGEARAKSDAYFEGGYWLQVWELLYTLAVAWLLLARRISTRLREFAERLSRGPNLQAFIYAALYIALVTLLTLPLTIYQGFYREHQYGLSNLSFGAWLGEAGIDLALSMLLLGLAVTIFYAILRRLPQSWWIWSAVAGGLFMAVLIMISPLYISPLFNTYKPLPDGALRDSILSMARANGIPADNVYYFDASKQTKRISANVSGLFGTTRISLNDNLLNRSSPAEIRAVMAHEMGHYVLNHALKQTVAFSLLLLGGLAFVRVGWSWAHARFASHHGVRGIEDPAGLPLLAAMIAVYLFATMPVRNTVIRSAETEADMFGLNASREPDGFAEAIFKLSEYRKLHPGPAEEFLMFDHPSGYNRIFAAMRWKAENAK